MEWTSSPDPLNERLIGTSPAMVKLKQWVHRLAELDVNVLIEGPSGSGKELVAELIHALSNRGNHRWVPINCGAIPTELFESELFGHRAGAFTGANEAQLGLVAMANHSTLFLDEIGELPKKMQVKLLRALETQMIRPLGASEEVSINARVIAATNQSLDQLIESGQFRRDLYHRLSVARVTTPALSELGHDLITISERLLDRVAKRLQLPKKPLSHAAYQALAQHPFHGNVRELEHCLTRGLIWSSGPEIDQAALGLLSEPESVSHQQARGQEPAMALPEALEQTERIMIARALRANGRKRHQTAAQLGITERALRYRLRKHGL